MTVRTLKRLHAAVREDIGELITRRPLPGPRIGQLDPFLLLNHHGPQVYPPGNAGLPFGPHPHRGFETVTFILHGQLEHRDSGGHESVIGAGGVQWMTAGRGVVHSELAPREFLERGGELEILQLWVNLPARMKMTEPRYSGLQAADIPAVTHDGAIVRPVSGEWLGQVGPIRPLMDVQLATVHLARGATARFAVPRGRTVLLYVVGGELRIDAHHAPRFTLVELNDDGDEFVLQAHEDSTVLLGHAAPLDEPVVAYGPFVMNTREEIHQAIRDYQAGRLG